MFVKLAKSARFTPRARPAHRKVNFWKIPEQEFLRTERPSRPAANNVKAFNNETIATATHTSIIKLTN